MGKKKQQEEKKPVVVTRSMLRLVVANLARSGLDVVQQKAVAKFIWGAWEWEAKDKRQLAEIAAKTLATMKANEALHASRPTSEEAKQELQGMLDGNYETPVADLVAGLAGTRPPSLPLRVLRDVTQGDEEVTSPQDDVSS